ncbi:MAG: M1 family metallopeptidase [Deltaproteobacteria bacterium]|nr:M1 family metallopeptidase [Deltaproteobacteria bacterium]
MAHPTDDKNFRLPASVRPSRYQATLTIDLKDKKFAGHQSVDIELQKPTRELALHAIELNLSQVHFHDKAGKHTGKVTVKPASETVLLSFDDELAAGEGRLEVHWTGAFCAGLRGLYAAGSVAVTQFEAADARRVFPCFDEPAFKARWALTLNVPQGAVALSNGEQLDRQSTGTTDKVVFKETPLLSSYLVAMAVGEVVSTPMQPVREVPTRTWSTPEKKHLAAFGQDVAVNVLPRLEDYFGLPYAFGKLDQIGIPDFEAGAMENAGLITYREVALLLDPATASLPVKKRVAEVVTHELAHQWFGNWVTMVWWDDLWLNEAFATWMAYKIVDQWHPEWRVWLDFDNGKAAALQLDALASTHPVRPPEIKNAAEATESFDAITYEKGGAVLRMIEGYLGEAPFRDGIRLYMKKFAQANATADDLWSSLGEASKQPVLELANAWIRQSGYPLLSASLNGKDLSLSQRRFFSAPGASGKEQWPVPVVLKFEDARGVREQRVLLRGDQRIALEAEGEVKWLCANAGATGFYRVGYDGALMAKLGKNLAKLSPAEKVSLLADGWALVRAGNAEIGAFLDFAQSYGNETDYAVLDELVARLSSIEHRLVSDADRPKLQQVVAKLLGNQLGQVGWDPKADEDSAPRLRRAAIVRALGGVARDAKVVAEASARLDRFLGGDSSAIEANLQDGVVGMAARAGDAKRFDQLLAKYRDEKDPAFKRRYLLSLTAFEDPALAKRAVEMALGETVPLQDLAFFIGGLLANRAAREQAFALVTTRWAEIEKKGGGAPMLLRRVVEAVGAMPERRHYEAAKTFFEAHTSDAIKMAVAQTLERLDQDTALRDRCMAPLSAWLAKA